MGRYEDALRDSLTGVTLDPSSEAYNTRGVAFYYLGKYQEALVNYDKAIELNPTYSVGLANRCLLRQILKEPGRALPDCDRAVTYADDSFARYHAHASRGALHVEQGRFEAAVVDFTAALLERPRSEGVLFSRAKANQSLRRDAAALADYKSVILVDPAHATAHNELAWLLLTTRDRTLRRPAEALKHALEAVKLEQHHMHLGTLGAAYVATGDLASAMTAYRESLTTGGRDWTTSYQKELSKKGCYTGPEDGSYSPAVEAALEKCARANRIPFIEDDLPAASTSSPPIAPKASEPAGDLETFKKLCFDSNTLLKVRLSSCSSLIGTSGLDADTLARAYLNRGIAQFNAGNYESSLADYERAMGLKPDWPPVHNNRAVSYRALGLHDLALAGYNRALELNPKEPLYYRNRCTLQGDRRQYADAVKDCRQALALAPTDGAALNSLAWILATASDPAFRDGPEAVALALRAVKIRQDPNWLDTLGAAYVESGRPNEAFQAYVDALRAGGASFAKTYQADLAKRGYYRGPMDGTVTLALDSAIQACVKAGCKIGVN